MHFFQHWTNEETTAQGRGVICPQESRPVVPGLGLQSHVGFSVFGASAQSKGHTYFLTPLVVLAQTRPLGSPGSEPCAPCPCCSVVFRGVSLAKEEIQSPWRVGMLRQLSVSSIKVAVELLCRGSDGAAFLALWSVGWGSLLGLPHDYVTCGSNVTVTILMPPYHFPTGQR